MNIVSISPREKLQRGHYIERGKKMNLGYTLQLEKFLFRATGEHSCT